MTTTLIPDAPDTSSELAGCTGDELVALVYVSGFQAGDAEDFGSGLVAAFAAYARSELTPGELAALCRVLVDPDPAQVHPDRLAACRQAADLIRRTGTSTGARPRTGVPDSPPS